MSDATNLPPAVNIALTLVRAKIRSAGDLNELTNSVAVLVAYLDGAWGDE